MSDANPCPTCGYQIDRVERINTENAMLRAALKLANGELQCLYHWLDRAVTSDYRYNNDPALPGHRKAAEETARAIDRALEQSKQF